MKDEIACTLIDKGFYSLPDELLGLAIKFNCAYSQLSWEGDSYCDPLCYEFLECENFGDVTAAKGSCIFNPKKE